jgi:hypothetical protein
LSVTTPATKLTSARLLDDAHRGCRTGDHLGIAALDHRAHVLEDDVAARTLGEAVADLLADHLVLIRGEPVGFRIGHIDGLNGHPCFVEEQRRLALCGAIGAARPARVGGNLLGGGGGEDSGTGNSPRLICCG